ncbi:MAG: hypothetical protein R6X02_30010 [Enhygromyxa sp.]
MPSTGLDQVLLDTAAHHLRPLALLLAAADPGASVSPRSRMLCAGLACLARSCYAALGGLTQIDEVGEAAAMLSLLTKIDDQVIDALEFHGGPLERRRDRAALERRTRAYLAPTLASIRAGQPANAEPRCLLAATLGRRLAALAGDRDRLAHLLDTIAFGWEVQVRAVRVLSSDPARVERAEVEAVTADISGAWLLMITMIGALPEDAARPLSADEIAGFYEWGLHIQTADALADLAKDTADGLVASRPGFELARTRPALWRAAFAQAELAPLYRGMVEAQIDLELWPAAEQLDALAQQLAGLGAVPSWLRWIHGFLSARWLVHPLCPRELEPGDELGRRLGRAWASGGRRLQTAMTLADSQGAQPCSGH